MANDSITTGRARPPQPGRPFRQLVVFLHGYAGDGAGMSGFASTVDKLLPEAAWEAPNAPQRCKVGPGHQWFPQVVFGAPVSDDGLRVAAVAVNRFIDGRLKHYGLPAGKLVLVGFGQGATLAVHVAVRRREPIAGVLAFSGISTVDPTLPAEIAARPPMLLVQADRDPLAPMPGFDAAVKHLQAQGIPLETLLQSGPLNPTEPDIRATAFAFVQRQLAGERATACGRELRRVGPPTRCF